MERYHVGDAAFYTELEGDKTAGERAMYQTFLIQTDYVPNKIVEAQALGIELDQDYTEILHARAFARAQMSMLDKMKE